VLLAIVSAEENISALSVCSWEGQACGQRHSLHAEPCIWPER